MAPGVGPLPAATGPDLAPVRRSTSVGPIEPLLAAMPARAVAQIRLGLRAVRVDAVSVAVLAREPRVAPGLPRPDRESGSPLRQDLLLLLKVLCRVRLRRTTPRVQAAVGYRAPTARVASGELRRAWPRDRRWASSSRRARPRSATSSIVGSGAGGAVAAAVLAEAGLEVLVLEAGPYLDRDSYPHEPLAAITSLYRDGGLTVAEGLTGDPDPGRARRRRDHGDQLGHLLSRSGTGARALGERARNRVGARARPRFRRRRGDARGAAGRPGDDGPKRPAPARGRRGAGRLPRAAGTATQAAASSAARARTGVRLDAKRAMHVSYLPRAVAAGARVRAGVEARRIVFAGGRATGVECAAGVARRGRRAPAAIHGARAPRGDLRRRRLRHPGAPAALGVSLAERRARPQPAHPPGGWVGARFDDEVRGWEGVMQSIRGRRVGAPRAHARGDVHAARLRRSLAARDRRRAPARACSTTVTSPRPASTSPTAPAAGSASPATARCGSATGSRAPTRSSSRSGSRGRPSSSTRPARARSTRRSPGSTRWRARGSPSSKPLPRPATRFASRRFTRWGPRAWTPTPGAASPRPTGRCTATSASTSPTRSLFPSSIGVNPMMTVIAMASRVATQLAAAAA